jgi:BMFP domain-containing protein YqiC
MGLIWNLIQHGQITQSRQQTESLEARVERLEAELHRTNGTLISLLRTLEERFGDDLDGDGRIG